jgi:hypothetical protein
VLSVDGSYGVMLFGFLQSVITTWITYLMTVIILLQCSNSVSVELLGNRKRATTFARTLTVSEQGVALVTFCTHFIYRWDQRRLCMSACSKFKITEQI